MPGRRPDLAFGAGGAVLGAGALAGAGVPEAIAAAVLGGALALVRRHPTAAWLVATIVLVGAAPFGVLPLGAFVLVAAHAFGAGRWAQRRSGVAGLVALVAAGLAAVWLASDSAVPYVLLTITPWAGGRALREHALVAGRLAERARELEEEREAHARLSVRYERARIASELHDIVAHAISVMVVQAAAGQRLAAVDPGLTAEAFRAIGDAARQAEDDMGRLIALLADENTIGEAPDLALVEELVARAAGTGLDVTLRLEGDFGGLPVSVVQTAYRVVQESLTNALRYASGAAVEVLVRGDAEALEVEVSNGPARSAATLDGHGTGSGLRGLRERLGAGGGAFAAGPTDDDGWKVTARMPRQVTAGAVT